MAIINLKKYYYPLITEDAFMEVPDDVAQAFVETEREARREHSRKHYYGVYSYDQSIGMENHFLFHAASPEELMVKQVDDAEYALLLSHLYEAIGKLSDTQRRRLIARYRDGMKLREIAEAEGVSTSCATESVASAIRKLKKIFKKNDWTRYPKEEQEDEADGRKEKTGKTARRRRARNPSAPKPAKDSGEQNAK